MALNCPLSCGICTHTCNDTDVSCGAWAKAGECDTNHEAMLRLCPTSCGLCTPICKDLSDECSGWGAAGECNANPEFMIRNCPVTCEACKSTCRDLHSDCPGWTADGECYNNAGFMFKTCPLSCGVCEDQKCLDGNSTQCQIWAEAGARCLPEPPPRLLGASGVPSRAGCCSQASASPTRSL